MSARLDRSAYELEFEERFDATELDATRWVAHYLPQWTTPEQSAAHFDLTQHGLRLRIDADQPPWRDGDGELRASNLQTGTFSGPVGSPRGQHRHTDGMSVVTEQPTRELYAPSAGLVEARLRAVADPTIMLAFWLIGFEEDSPDDSGEICVVELFGDSIGVSSSELSIGVKAHHDPRLTDDMDRVPADLDATDWHTYAAAWDADEIRFYVDDELIRTVSQSIAYPMQLMVDLFEFPASPERDPRKYPKTGDVSSVLGYRPR
ncbi:MAG TPA: glycoside hydrolase family 16 protein [Actinomycetes bacterium]|nr:glycoside hydrolase family 16 protein [Actinomycetes bacterium]